MEQQAQVDDIINKEIGTKEPVKKTLEPKKVIITAVKIKKKTTDGKDMKVPLVEFMCKHPDKEEIIYLSKVKYQLEDKIVTAGTWAVVDEDNNLQKGSAVTRILEVLGVKSLAEAYNKEIETVTESKESSFLCLKAY